MINIPSNLSRYYSSEILIINNVPVETYIFDNMNFYFNEIFVISIFVTTVFRDPIILIVEIITIIAYAKILKLHYRLKFRLQAINKTMPLDHEYKNIMFLMCFFSLITHILTIFAKIQFFFYSSNEIYNYILAISTLLSSFKNSMNFFIFLKFNRRFKKRFFQFLEFL